VGPARFCFNERRRGVRESALYLLKAVVKDFWDNPGKEGAADFKAGVGIDFNQVQSEIFVKHKIISEQLKQKKETVRPKT